MGIVLADLAGHACDGRDRRRPPLRQAGIATHHARDPAQPDSADATLAARRSPDHQARYRPRPAHLRLRRSHDRNSRSHR
jgi:hypothetical protein